MKRQNLLVFFLIMLQISCSPIYHNTKEYKEPESEDGKACVINCNYVKNDCYRQCQVDVTNCKLTEKMINSQVRSQPIVSIINNSGNSSKNDNNSQRNVDNQESCRNENLKCKESCNNDIMCQNECDTYMDICDMRYMRRKFNNNENFNKFFSDIRKNRKSSFTVRDQQHLSLCQVDKCDELCKKDYDLCFSSCGGKIVTYRQCIAFCDKR